ncbi:hypothetical protein yc1106_09300 [Curvularia clavata]|uniref:Uncharacterized protein n=1 Tax=Curvularia clavata TaxID=95742 RepID=A0A9Q9DXZ7_CURCL|nr:hypothetical protein yc1106_09300 [Curvularia clavata]
MRKHFGCIGVGVDPGLCLGGEVSQDASRPYKVGRRPVPPSSQPIRDRYIARIHRTTSSRALNNSHINPASACIKPTLAKAQLYKHIQVLSLIYIHIHIMPPISQFPPARVFLKTATSSSSAPSAISITTSATSAARRSSMSSPLSPRYAASQQSMSQMLASQRPGEAARRVAN